MDDVERVARIVDWKAWTFYDRHIGDLSMKGECNHEVGPSLATARQILSTLPTDARLREAIRAIELNVDALNTKSFRQRADTQLALDRIKNHCRAALLSGERR